MTQRDGAWQRRAALGGALLGAASGALTRSAGQRADVRIGDAVRRFSNPVLDRSVVATTDLGSVYSVIGAAATLAVAGQPRTAADVLGIGGAAWTLAQVSKTRVRRQRPFQADEVRRLIRVPTGSSFPSGHAAVGMAVAALLADRAGTSAGRRGLYALGGYVAASRVYVGVHYPTDVIGGAGLGLALAAVWRGPVASGARAITGMGLRGARAGVGPALRALTGLRRPKR